MKEISAEDIVMNLVCNGGDCRSHTMEAMAAAREGDFEKADAIMKEGEASMFNAHHFQTDLIQQEMDEDAEKTEVSLLMVHGQDHLMDAMVVHDLGMEIIELYKKIYELCGK